MIDLSYASVNSIKRMLNDFIYFMSSKADKEESFSAHGLKEFIESTQILKVSITNQRKDLPSFKTNSITLKYIINTLVSNAQKYSKPSDKQPDFF